MAGMAALSNYLTERHGEVKAHIREELHAYASLPTPACVEKLKVHGSKALGKYRQHVELGQLNAAGNDAHHIGQTLEAQQMFADAIVWHRCDVRHQQLAMAASTKRSDREVATIDLMDAHHRLGACLQSEEVGKFREAAAHFSEKYRLASEAGHGPAVHANDVCTSAHDLPPKRGTRRTGRLRVRAPVPHVTEQEP